MSYDLAVWDGPEPADDASAAREFARRVEEQSLGLPPAPAIQSLIEALTRRFPDLTELSDEELDSTDTPWASGPLTGEASGDFLYVPLTHPGARAHLAEVVSIVHQHGLVCFDPQLAQVHRRTAPRTNPPGAVPRNRPGLVARHPLLRLPITFGTVAVLLFLLDKCTG